MFIGSGRRKNSRRKSYGVCDDDFCIYGNSGNNCIGDCRDNQHNWAYCFDCIVNLLRQARCARPFLFSVAIISRPNGGVNRFSFSFFNGGLIFLSHLLLDEALHTRGAEHRAVPCQNGIRADRQTAHRLCL